VTTKERNPLSCKFDPFLIVLGKGNDVISDWLGLDSSFVIFQVDMNIIHNLLSKLIKNRSNFHARGVHYLVVTLHCLR